jgi:hypothetical protein
MRVQSNDIASAFAQYQDAVADEELAETQYLSAANALRLDRAATGTVCPSPRRRSRKNKKDASRVTHTQIKQSLYSFSADSAI